MSKKNIYQTQMNKLGLNASQYAKLTGIPEEMTNKLLKGKDLDTNMKMNNFLRKVAIQKFNELESDNAKTLSKAIEIKIEDKEKEKEQELETTNKKITSEENLMDWYVNEFDLKKLMFKTNCISTRDFINTYKLTLPFSTKKVSDVVYDRLLKKKISEIGKETLPFLVKQLYEIYNSNNEIDIGNKFLLNWYNNEYNRETLLQKTNCASTREFRDKYDIIINGKKASKWFYNCIVNKNQLSGVNQKVLINFAKQLKDIYEGKTTDVVITENKVMNKKELSKLLQWHKEFDYQQFMKEYSLTNDDLIKDLNLAYSTIKAITSKKKTYTPSKKLIAKIKDYVESYGKEEIEEIEIPEESLMELQEIEPLESSQIGNIVVAPMDNDNGTFVVPNNNSENAIINDLKELIKERLTEQEKALIKLFGGNI